MSTDFVTRGTPPFSTRVDPSRQSVVKFLPSNPPMRGEYVLVDGVRCRVTRCRVRWDGPRWTIKTLRVRAAAERVGWEHR